MSQHGARGAVSNMPGVLALLDPLLSEALDRPELAPEKRQFSWERSVLWIAWLLAEEQRSSSKEIGCSTADLEYTLALAVVGESHAGWMQIGDAVVVPEVKGMLGLAERPFVGTFPGATEFLRYPIDPRTIRTGLISTTALDSIAVCSDGTAFHFVDQRSCIPAEAFRQIFDAIRSGECTSVELQTLIAAPRWSKSHGDDRALAMLVRNAPRIVRSEREASVQSEAVATPYGREAFSRLASAHSHSRSGQLQSTLAARYGSSRNA